MVQLYAPQAYFVFHDAYRYEAHTWNDLFNDYHKVALDHHYYQTFSSQEFSQIVQNCQDYQYEAKAAKAFKMEVWFGEWSLATDNCAMWLGGFNDIGPNTPYHEC